MTKPWDEPMSQEELNRFKALKDIQVVFDIGTRTSLDYLAIRPDAEYHLFEPWPLFSEWLIEATKDKPNVIVNRFGLSDKEDTLTYDINRQAFIGGESPASKEGMQLNLQTLDWYVDTFNITRIDYLKIDAEGYDYKILKGGAKAIKLAKYIQYEYWDDPEEFKLLLGNDFNMEDIGLRNVLCTRK
jgi:FkbM family methyltransferase